jgi:hypothetical protein
MQSDVLAFHRFFGLYANTFPGPIPTERYALRRSLIAEENSELWQAVSRFDMPGAADGICDLLYVTLGTRVEFGFAGCAPVGLKPAPAIAFPEGKRVLQQYREAFARRLSALSKALSTTNLSDIDGHTESVARACCGLAAAFGLPLQACWNEVHSSNMTKAELPEHGLDCALPRGLGQCSCGAVLYREDGKLLKGKNFRPPALAAILAAAGYAVPVADKDTGGTLYEGPERPATVSDIPAMRGK